MPDPARPVSDGSMREPTEAMVEAAILAASNPVFDDGHTDTYYAGILAAALAVAPVVPREEYDRLREALAAIRLEYDARQECADSKLMRDYAQMGLDGRSITAAALSRGR